ncbi:tetratricopeptide repeat protein [Candidatus Roizmanbacteria bacterium]|nr:tetratricopeptide repeat protein [Candidatus Roizmanbacteria bacterium]
MYSTVKEWIKDYRISLTILLLLVVVVYMNSLGNGFVIDDNTAISNNPKITSFKSVTDRPLFVQPLLYFIVSNLFGPNPTMFRLVNILFHIGTVWITFILLSITSGPIIGFFTASLFAVHPIVTESVVWISGGPHVIYSFFLLFSLLFYVLSSNKKTYYWVSLIFFLLALATSEKAIIFPGILLFYEIALSDIKKSWKKIAPFFIFSGVLVLRVYLPQVGERAAEFQKNVSVKPVFNNPVILIPYAVSSYLQLIFWPIRLSLFHYQTKISLVEYLARLLVFLPFIGLIGLSFQKNRHIFFWLCFFITSIAWTFLPFGVVGIVAERYVYLGTIGVLFLLGYILEKLLEAKRTETLAILLFIIFMIFFMIRTVVRNFDWKNEESLWFATVKTDFIYHGAHNKLGELYERKGDLANAIKEYKIALRLNPNYPEGYSNLGAAYLKMRKLSEASEAFNKSIQLNPWLWQPYQNLAVIYYGRGSYDKAIEYTKAAIQKVPKTSDQYLKANSELYFNLGAMYLKKGDKKKAKEAILAALGFNPQDPKARKILLQLRE